MAFDLLQYFKKKSAEKGSQATAHQGRGLTPFNPAFPLGRPEAAIYSEILASGYFDAAWYRLAYRNEIEYPQDLLLDYLGAGIQKGRDPSPYFNTVLYRREFDVPAEQALVHFLRSGKTMTSGAYRHAKDLLATQRTFIQRTVMQLTKDKRSVARPFAVYLQCGSGTEWEHWKPETGQLWDLIINHYDASFVGRIPCEVEFTQTGAIPGTKFTSFYSVLERYRQMIEPYEFILLLDDDILFEHGDIDRLFEIASSHRYEMAQASLSHDSHGSFQVFRNTGTSGCRRVNGVEIMMPIYSRRVFDIVYGLWGKSVSGWGLDAALSMISAERGFQSAVVDDIVARHIKPINADIGKYYQMLHRAQIYPEIEFTHLQKEYGYTKPLFYELEADERK